MKPGFPSWGFLAFTGIGAMVNVAVLLTDDVGSFLPAEANVWSSGFLTGAFVLMLGAKLEKRKPAPAKASEDEKWDAMLRGQ